MTLEELKELNNMFKVLLFGSFRFRFCDKECINSIFNEIFQTFVCVFYCEFGCDCYYECSYDDPSHIKVFE